MDAIEPHRYSALVACGDAHWRAERFLEASVVYLHAARLAPALEEETLMLQWAYESEERANGRVSELEME